MKLHVIFIFLVVQLVFTSCSHSTKNSKIISFDSFLSDTNNFEVVNLTNREKFDVFLKNTKDELLNTSKKRKINFETWTKIGRALNTYKILISNQNSTRLTIPEKQNLKLKFNSFCIDPGKGIPNQKETFEWILAEPSPVLFYSKIIKYYSLNSNVNEELVQELIWNLSNRTYYENYPDKLKVLLNKIERGADKKVPSALKNKILDTGITVFSDVSGIDVHNAINLVQGKYYDYIQIKSNLEKLKSNYSLSDEINIVSIPDTDLFVRTSSISYRQHIVDFYNPSEVEQTIDLSNYYLKPLRPDVQRIALAAAIDDKQYYTQRLDKFFKEILSHLVTIYPTLTNEEKILIQQYPYESLRVLWHQFKSEYATDKLFVGGSIDGEADAFRHYVWAGFLTHDLGKNLAEKYLNAHEAGQSVYSPDRRMDEYNNKKGIEGALRLEKSNQFSNKNLYKEAISELKNNKLIVIKPTGKVPDDVSY
ncbi:MAG: hypothetical protein IPM57_06690 [Oligoflexia bacterium]|nr:hypothetical protein [Oligoflexia bacterium]